MDRLFETIRIASAHVEPCFNDLNLAVNPFSPTSNPLPSRTQISASRTSKYTSLAAKACSLLATEKASTTVDSLTNTRAYTAQETTSDRGGNQGIERYQEDAQLSLVDTFRARTLRSRNTPVVEHFASPYADTQALS
jgi:hypothetical protein